MSIPNCFSEHDKMDFECEICQFRFPCEEYKDRIIQGEEYEGYFSDEELLHFMKIKNRKLINLINER